MPGRKGSGRRDGLFCYISGMVRQSDMYDVTIVGGGNGTLRITFGTVKGVAPRDGVIYAPQTRLAGVLEKHRPGDPEFGAPADLLAAIRAEEARRAEAARSPPPLIPRTDSRERDFLSVLHKARLWRDLAGGRSAGSPAAGSRPPSAWRSGSAG